MDQISLKAYAKVNLTLDVVGKREDSYHLVKMIMQQIDIYDTVILHKQDEGIALECDNPYVPSNAQNIAWKAAALMQDVSGVRHGVKVTIKKHIPVAAGLAGGSTDAAAVIHGFSELYGLNMNLEEKMRLGLSLGADVPFCLLGGAALAEGIGEALTPIAGFANGWLVVCKPNFGVSTREIYKALDWTAIENHPDTEGMLAALADGSIQQVCACLGNVLEPVTAQRYSEVKRIKDRMLQYGAEGALMSGSGPTVFGVFKSMQKARSACDNLKRYYRQTYAVKTIMNQGERR